MENKNNPLSPHVQIYRWHISSLLSITHRIVGILNFFAVILMSVLLIFNNLDLVIFQKFSQSFIGKFFIVSFCWTFSFQILNEIRHLFWDMGFGFDLKISKISGVITIISSFILAVLFYLLGRSLV
tara:strand:- start:625 stop:1002 length:378 start_codon:yes stop_codon:yes gene_type:complete